MSSPILNESLCLNLLLSLLLPPLLFYCFLGAPSMSDMSEGGSSSVRQREPHESLFKELTRGCLTWLLSSERNKKLDIQSERTRSNWTEELNSIGTHLEHLPVKPRSRWHPDPEWLLAVGLQ